MLAERDMPISKSARHCGTKLWLLPTNFSKDVHKDKANAHLSGLLQPAASADFKVSSWLESTGIIEPVSFLFSIPTFDW
ncbi:hypothetical protein HPB50_020165 [Hyalomma asiaticum]|uniref:Uncharacterized protein n=1 Tax=Hyalomma asiaticum TaxID=266040 RepID=A0ACB7TKU5_HYAAI|nr:hypothetical protein HPB50_020165 [Hyalomma asiaticum]